MVSDVVTHRDLGPLRHVAVLIGIAVDGLDSHVVLKLIRRGRELDVMPEGEFSQPQLALNFGEILVDGCIGKILLYRI